MILRLTFCLNQIDVGRFFENEKRYWYKVFIILRTLNLTTEPALDKIYNKTREISLRPEAVEGTGNHRWLWDLIRAIADHMCLLQPPSYPKRDKREALSHWVDVEVDLTLSWSHRSYCSFFFLALAHHYHIRVYDNKIYFSWAATSVYTYPASILYKSIAGRYRPVSYPDGPITARYRFINNAYWDTWIVRPTKIQISIMRSLIRVFVVRMKTLCILGYLNCAQQRFWSDCAMAQAGPYLLHAHTSEDTFYDSFL